jgi:hypothetical protein
MINYRRATRNVRTKSDIVSARLPQFINLALLGYEKHKKTNLYGNSSCMMKFGHYKCDLIYVVTILKKYVRISSGFTARQRVTYEMLNIYTKPINK